MTLQPGFCACLATPLAFIKCACSASNITQGGPLKVKGLLFLPFSLRSPSLCLYLVPSRCLAIVRMWTRGAPSPCSGGRRHCGTCRHECVRGGGRGWPRTEHKSLRPANAAEVEGGAHRSCGRGRGRVGKAPWTALCCRGAHQVEACGWITQRASPARLWPSTQAPALGERRLRGRANYGPGGAALVPCAARGSWDLRRAERVAGELAEQCVASLGMGNSLPGVP